MIVRLLWPRRLAALLALAAVAAWGLPRYGAVFVGGWSMSPTLAPGDMVMYRRDALPCMGSVVLVTPPGGAAYVHRVVLVDEWGRLTTRGDANDRDDSALAEPEAVAGVATLVVPSGRYLHALVSGVRWCFERTPIARAGR